jgi:hypothetical protein
VDPRILDLGFEIVNECKLLGFLFSNSTPLADTNGRQLVAKINSTLRFWLSFNLSIAGKITVVKSLVMPLFIYYGTVLNFETGQLTEMEDAISRFVTRGFNISKNKIFASTGEGGLGLFKLVTFSCTLQSYWFKRVAERAHDNWRLKILELSAGNPYLITEKNLDLCGPVLKGIIKNYISFRNIYGTVGNNFITVPILNNTNFFFSINRERKNFDHVFFGDACDYQVLINLTWADLTENFIFRSRRDIRQNLGIILNADQYEKLKSSYANAHRKYYSARDKTLSLQVFFAGIKKGSRKLRTVANQSKNNNSSVKCSINKYLNIAGVELPERQIVVKLNNNWTRHFLNSDFRTFLFKLYNNTLGINARVNHYNPDRGPECTFCLKRKSLPADRETIQDFFFGTVQPPILLNFEMTKKIFS